MVAMVVLVMMVAAAAAAAAVGCGWWLSYWKSAQLLRACARQGISGFTLSPLQTAYCAEGRSWDLLNSIQKHGKMFYVKFGKVVSLVVLDPSSVQQLLTQNADCYEKGLFVRALGILGNGVFSSSGSDWMDQRQLLGHCFFMRELKDHFETIKDTAKHQVECWSTLATEVVDIHKLFLELTVGLIGEVAIGESIEKKTAIMIFERFNSYLHKSRQIVCSPFFSFIGDRWKSQHIMEDEKYLLTTIKELVCKREHKLNSPSSKEGLAIDLLIERAQEKDNLNHNLVIDNTSTLLLAGHETTANLLTWTVYLLGTHLKWQEEARSEVQGIEELDMKNMGQLKILGMILWESLRLYPPQPIIGRRCVRENTVNNIIVPKDLEVIIPVSALHRNKDLWGQDSEEFKPGRFANGINKACKVPSSFLPFGSGPRTCIGQTLALLEAKIILYHMLRNYSWEISAGYHHCPDVTLTLQPQFGMPIMLVRQ